MLRSLSSFLALLLSLTVASGVFAAQRTFVSTSGSDANTASNCSTTAPCRGFTAALTVTDSGGEIIVLTSGGYGPVTIDKSVSIIAPQGIYAGISVFSGNGITIATAGIDVVLRGLTINGVGGSNGIFMTTGNSLVVQDCVVTHFTSGYGLYVNTAARVRLLDSLLQGNDNGAQFSAGPTVLVSGSRYLDNANNGQYASASSAGVVTRVEVSRSEATGNGGTGFFGYTTGSGRTELSVKDSVASRNFNGIYAYSTGGVSLAMVSNNLVSGSANRGLIASGTGAKLTATGNKVTNNATGLRQEGSAVLQSTGDNTVSDNTTETSGTITGLGNI